MDDLGFIPLTDTFSQVEQQNGLPSGVLNAVMTTESNGDPNVVGSSGEKGLFQFMPQTAKEYNINPTDPIQSVNAAGQYLGKYYNQTGDLSNTLAAYNAGPNNMNNPPSSTKEYISKVLSNMNSSSNNDLGFIPDQSSEKNTSMNSTSTSNNDLGFIPLPSDESGLSPIIGSTLNSIGAGLSTMPGAKQIGAGIASVINKTPYSQEIEKANQIQNQAEEANPIIYNATSIGANTLPFLATGGLGTVSKIAANTAIGASGALSNGASPTEAAITGALTGPIAESLPLVQKGINTAGNIIGGVGDFIPDFIKNIMDRNLASDTGIMIKPSSNPLIKTYNAYKSEPTGLSNFTWDNGSTKLGRTLQPITSINPAKNTSVSTLVGDAVDLASTFVANPAMGIINLKAFGVKYGTGAASALMDTPGFKQIVQTGISEFQRENNK